LIKIRIKLPLLIYKIVLFANQPNKMDFWKFVEFAQCKSRSAYFGFIREKCFTKIINLSQKKEGIFDKFKKNTRYEINKAKKKGVISKVEDDLEEFVIFYNLFAQSKNRQTLNIEQYSKNYKDNIIITKASYKGTNLVMHSYLIDKNGKRVRLFNSASSYGMASDTDKVKLIGMANRFLHFADMIFFKESNYEIYDLGGYNIELKDDKLNAINQFKDSFGGDLLEESVYISFPLFIYRYLRRMVKALIVTIRHRS
jgi:lipid II:glycine glycyltransferase (peptidoglycan interpeptide bridge formation enzyme)